MKFKKLSVTLLAGLMLCSALTGCGKSNKNNATPTDATNATEATTESAPVIDITTVGKDESNANENGWIPAQVYIDVIESANRDTPDKYLQTILDCANTDEGIAHLLVAVKHDGDNTTFAYEATKSGEGTVYIMYVTIDNDNKITDVTTGNIIEESEFLITELATSTDISDEDK